MRYQAVLFDLFGTLVPFSPKAHDQVLSALATTLHLPTGAFTRAWEASFVDQEVGVYPTLEATLEYICQGLAHERSLQELSEAARQYRTFQQRLLVAPPEVVALLQRLHAAGKPIGVLSNCPLVVAQVWPETALAGHVDAALFSCQVGVRKPDARIYLHACEQLWVASHTCLYVGDGGSHELTGARQVGMEAVLLHRREEDPEDARRLGREAWSGPQIGRLQEVLPLLEPQFR